MYSNCTFKPKLNDLSREIDDSREDASGEHEIEMVKKQQCGKRGGSCFLSSSSTIQSMKSAGKIVKNR